MGSPSNKQEPIGQPRSPPLPTDICSATTSLQRREKAQVLLAAAGLSALSRQDTTPADPCDRDHELFLLRVLQAQQEGASK